jgi:hypothetical protein
MTERLSGIVFRRAQDERAQVTDGPSHPSPLTLSSSKGARPGPHPSNPRNIE